MITYDELEEYSRTAKTSSYDRTNAYFQGTEEIYKFSENIITPVLNSQIQLNEREEAIIGTYYRMHCCLASMVKLNERQYVQQVVSAARTIFELFIDLEILSRDKSDVSVGRFHAFPQIAKYKSARKLVNFAENNPDREILEFDHRKRFLDDPANSVDKIESIITEHWGEPTQKILKNIQHWTGLDLRARVRDLGVEYEQMYVEISDWQSWYIHSGSTGFVGLNRETYEAVFGYSHVIVQKTFLKSILICGEELCLDKIDNLRGSLKSIVKRLESHPGQVMLEKDIEALKKLKES